MSPPCAPLVLLLASWIAAPGCQLGGGDPCMVDGDCAGGEECTRTGECVTEGTALRVVVRWTVAGEAPTPAASAPCEGIAELAVEFRGGFSEPERYRPVPCELGQAVYDKMPPYFWVDVIAYDGAGALLDRRSEPLARSGETDVMVDLAP